MIHKMEKIINNIRDIFRKEGITGMDSIKHSIAFICFRMLNEQKCEHLNIDKKLAFKNVIKKYKNDQDLFDIFYMKRNKKLNFIGEFVNTLNFKNFKFKLESPKNVKKIINFLEKINVDKLSINFDIIGTIYEIHLKSGTSNSMRDLGQYYTHRLVINYMIKLCDPKMKKGIVETIVDPTMGTGGFLTMAIKYLNNKYKNKIKWRKNKNKIIGFDIDENVRNMALLNIFMENGELCKNTIVKQDTLHNDMRFRSGKILKKADVILANEPMGIKGLKYSECCKRIRNFKIKGTKAEPLFMQLFMRTLNKNGRCAVIIPDGVLFNESNLHKNTRKHLIENFNLKKVIELKDDKFFLNTGVNTSILFFVNNGKTKEVQFCDITINDKEIIEEKEIIKVKYNTLKDNNYSLFVNKYNIEKEAEIEGVKYMKLGDICEFEKKSKRKASF